VSSSGALEVLAKEGKLYRSDQLHTFLMNCRSKGWLVLGTHLEVESLSMNDLPRGQPMLVVIGNEGKGLRSSILKCCESSIRIPMAADVFSDLSLSSPLRRQVDSLNVGVATGVLLSKLMSLRV
jgi:21S rRNA (GM2251-2'-O)-methyltransferase